MEEMPLAVLIATLGFVLGLGFGATVQRTNFCSMGAISDIVFMGDWSRFRAWMLAAAVAIFGAQALHGLGVFDLNRSIYLTPNFGWFGAILGGLMFGFGMTMSGGCGGRTLVRLGAGNLKSLVVALVMGVFAYMTLRGLTGMARVEMEAATIVDLKASGFATQGLPDLLAGLTGLGPGPARWIMTLLVGGGLLVYCLRDGAFRRSRRNVAAGVITGLLVLAGWYVTGVVGMDEFEPTPLASLTFVAPVGDGLVYLMTFSGSRINFGIAVTGGVIAGSFLMALARGEFRIEAFAGADDMARHLIGGALMGMGGILALGCTIGQGITGMSTLAFGSLIALASIIAGGVYGMKYFEEGSLIGALKALARRG